MARSILIVSTLDTKGDQVEFLNQVIKQRGNKTMVMDVGVKGEPPFQPEITHDQVAQAVDMTLNQLKTLSDVMDPKPAMDKMAEGAYSIVKDLCTKDKLNGIVALGGSMGTSLALDVIKAAPIGIPKIIMSTVAHSHAISMDMLGGNDVMMLPWSAGLWGLNDVSRGALQTAGGAISGAADEYDKKETSGKKIVGATSLGATGGKYMNWIKPALETKGYEVAVYHVTGMSGRMYERTIADGMIDISLDLAAGVELLNHVNGSVFTAGEQRLEAAGRRGIPQIVSTGAIEIIHWGQEPLPERFDGRFQIAHNKILYQVYSIPEECAQVGALMAKKLNMATGPTAVVLPMQSFGPPPPPPPPGSGEGKDMPPPPPAELSNMFEITIQSMKALHDALMQDIKPHIKVTALDVSLNDPAFAEGVLKVFEEMIQE
jgi:uncharacterized protein (UPF0261 family)